MNQILGFASLQDLIGAAIAKTKGILLYLTRAGASVTALLQRGGNIHWIQT